MKKYEGFLLATDIDHTLLTYEPKAGETYFANGLNQIDLDAIEEFKREGGLFTIATGRAPSDLGVLPEYIHPNTWFVACNGTAVVDWYTHQAVDSIFSGGDMLDVIDFFRKKFPFFRHFQIIDSTLTLLEWHREECPAEDVIAKCVFPIYKFIFIHTPEETEILRRAAKDRFGDRYHICRSAPHLIECQKIGSTKAEGLRLLRNRLGGKVHTLVCAGDYENDIDMLRAADIGYAVENALPCVKEAADRITVASYDCAIARIISEIGNT